MTRRSFFARLLAAPVAAVAARLGMMQGFAPEGFHYDVIKCDDLRETNDRLRELNNRPMSVEYHYNRTWITPPEHVGYKFRFTATSPRADWRGEA